MSNALTSAVDDEMSLLKSQTDRRTTLVRSLFRVLYCFEQYLGIEETPELKTQYQDTLTKMYKYFGSREEKTNPDYVLTSIMLTFLDKDIKGRFKCILSSSGSKAKCLTTKVSIMDLHACALKQIEYPFYTITVCMYQDKNIQRDDGFTAMIICGDQVFLDNNDEERLNCFNVSDIPTEMGVDPREITVKHFFVLEMIKCTCGCHDIIEERVNKYSL